MNPCGPFFPLLHFWAKCLNLAPVLQRLDPTQKAVSLFASKVLAWIGTFALLSFWTSQASPSVGAGLWGISTLKLPSHASTLFDLTAQSFVRLRVFLRRQLGYSPLSGRRPVWPFRSPLFSHLFERFTRSGLFFHLRNSWESYNS
jgi:hypothetical protein